MQTAKQTNTKQASLMKPMETSKPLYLSEQMIYGSSRIGVLDRSSLNLTGDEKVELSKDGTVSVEKEARRNILSGKTTPPGIEPVPLVYTHTTHTLGLKNYELTNHLGNVLTTVSDRKLTTTPGHFTAEITSTQDYYPFGSLMPGRKYSSNSYRFGFNGMEKDDEVFGSTGTSYTAQFWQYDSRLGRRWNLDPKPNPSISQYTTFNLNPIMFTDVLGDSSVWDNKGYMVHYDPNDKDLRAFMQDGDNLTLIGELGGDIDVNVILDNLLKDNADESYKQTPIGWFLNVKKDGVWDYKNNKSTIFGIAWSYDESQKKKDPNAKKTNFLYKDFSYDGIFNAADVGNYNAGWTGTHTGVPMWLQKVGAGHVEQLKQDFNGTMWDPVQYIENCWLDKYWGDRPADYYWNEKGMKDAKKDMEANPRVLY